MKLVSGILGMTLASVVAIASANAADMYRAPEGVSYKDTPVFEAWAGPYVGINGGYAWGAIRTHSILRWNLFNRGGHSGRCFASTGWFGGGQIGYNWQRGNLVLGIEADIQGADITGSATTAGWQ